MEEQSCLFESRGNRFAVERALEIVIASESIIEGIQQPAVVFGIHHAIFHTMFPEGGMHTSVFPIPQVFLSQERLRSMQHGLIGTADREFRAPITHQGFRRPQGPLSLLKEFASLLLHAAIASSLRLRKNIV